MATAAVRKKKIIRRTVKAPAQRYRLTSKWWDMLVAAIVSVLLFGFLMASMVTKYGEYAFGALIVGILFWASFELITPASHHWMHVFVRVVPAVFVGMIIGGALTYYTQFGFYFIQPALAGILWADVTLLLVVLYTVVLLYVALWAHQRRIVA